MSWEGRPQTGGFINKHLTLCIRRRKSRLDLPIKKLSSVFQWVNERNLQMNNRNSILLLVGRWWMTGSSLDRIESDFKATSFAARENTKLLELARKQRMNTDVRKNIFLVIMTSEVSRTQFPRVLSNFTTCTGGRDQCGEKCNILHSVFDVSCSESGCYTTGDAYQGLFCNLFGSGQNFPLFLFCKKWLRAVFHISTRVCLHFYFI